jgi:hypothetical protein
LHQIADIGASRFLTGVREPAGSMGYSLQKIWSKLQRQIRADGGSTGLDV